MVDSLYFYSMELHIKSKRGIHICLYDECDHSFVSSHKWHVSAQGYATTNVLRNGRKTCVAMHSMLLGNEVGSGFITDHKNRNRLDNRRDNLRRCTRSENNRNVTACGKSKYIGVVYDIHKSKKGSLVYIKAQITVNGKNLNLGRFKTEVEAAKARDEAAKKYHGEFASLNFPQ